MDINTKMYNSLVALFLDIVQGLEGVVVQGYTGEDHIYFVVEKFNPNELKAQYPQFSSIAKLGRAKSGQFVAEIKWDGVDMDYHEFAQQVVRCLNCGFVDTLNFHSGVPADRANEVWDAFVKHQKSGCERIDLHMLKYL